MMTRLLAVLALFFGATMAHAQDYVLDNQSGAAFRAELNTILGAIAKNNAGTTAPPATFQNMWWIDTDPATPLWKMRNTANTAWLTFGEIGASAVTWTGALDVASGEIDGVAIGATTPSTAVFTTVEGTNFLAEAANPTLSLWATGAAADSKQMRFAYNSGNFDISTFDSAGTVTTVDMRATVATTGVTEWSYRIEGTEVVEVLGTQFTYNRSASSTSGFQYVSGGIGQYYFGPLANAVDDLGSTSFRWDNAYLANSPNVSSDARLKSDIGPILPAECRAANRIEFKRFRKDGTIHFGAIAQEVEAAFVIEGLDPDDYALVQTGADGFKSVIYDELQSLKAACQ